jgi:protein-tyrosine phosphatase
MSIFGRLFGRKKETGAPVSLGSLKADMHSHVIPGIDDGAGTMQDSLDMLHAFAALGYEKVITTPHIMSDGYRNTPEIILGGLEKVRVAAKGAGIDIQIEAAAEYYLDEVFVSKLDKGLLSFGGEKRYVLFETSYVTQPMALSQTIFQLQTLGYTPRVGPSRTLPILLGKQGCHRRNPRPARTRDQTPSQYRLLRRPPQQAECNDCPQACQGGPHRFPGHGHAPRRTGRYLGESHV